MRRASIIFGLLLLVASTGCVYRRMTILSEPAGARVFVNNVEVGSTPCNVPTNVYLDQGNYKITLFKDGYEPLEVLQPVPPKPYQYPGIDFLAEISPFNYHDHRIFSYQMQPMREKSGDELKQQADEFRQRGSGVLSTPLVPGVSPPPNVVMPPPVNGTAPPPNTVEPGRVIPVPPQ